MNETDLRTAFNRLADDEAPRSNVNVSDAIRHGHRRGHLRRLTAGASALAVCGALVGIMLAVRPAARPNVPVVTPTGTPVSPTPSTSPTATAERPPVALLDGAVLRFPDGHNVTLNTSPGDEAGQAVVTPDGIVFTAYDASGAGATWWQAGTAAAVKVTDGNGNFEVSPDGKTLVVTDVDGQSSKVAAYALPSRHRLGSVQFTAPVLGPVVLNISGDWVLIAAANGSPASGAALAWNLLTGFHQQLWPESAGAWPIAITADGKVIARYDTMVGKKPRACYRTRDVAAIVAGTGFAGGHCTNAPTEVTPAPEDLSPDGKWLVFPTGALQKPGAWIIAVNDINSADAAGHRLAATTTLVDVWVSATTFIAQGDINGADGNMWQRCAVNGACQSVEVIGDSIPIQTTGF